MGAGGEAQACGPRAGDVRLDPEAEESARVEARDVTSPGSSDGGREWCRGRGAVAGWAGPPFGGLAAGRSVRPQGLAQAHCIQGCGEVPGAWRTWPEMRTQAETGRRAQARGPWGWSWVGGRGAGGFGAAFPALPAPWSARGPAQPCFPGPQEAAGSRRGALRTPHPASAAPQPPARLREWGAAGAPRCGPRRGVRGAGVEGRRWGPLDVRWGCGRGGTALCSRGVVCSSARGLESGTGVAP